MNIQHFEKGVTITADELVVLARKLGKLATYCKRLKDEASSIRVESEKRDTKKDRDQVKVMMTVTLPKKQFRAESRRPDLLEAVDRCAEKLEPQLMKYKELHTGKGRAHAVARKLKNRRGEA
jgi:ribosomal subunit interface protein